MPGLHAALCLRWLAPFPRRRNYEGFTFYITSFKTCLRSQPLVLGPLWHHGVPFQQLGVETKKHGAAFVKLHRWEARRVMVETAIMAGEGWPSAVVRARELWVSLNGCK